ncbi:MAG: PAS domain S-box protein [Euryarchaeota archaeon]|nr:PAS domain S-box protein [Euryarchaeota archaeon]
MTEINETSSMVRGPGEAQEAKMEIPHEHLENILKLAGVAIVTLDEKGCIKGMNPAAERLLGRPAEGVVGRPFGLILAEEDRKRFREDFEEVKNGGHEGTGGVLGIVRDGKEVFLEYSLYPWSRGGRAVLLVYHERGA